VSGRFVLTALFGLLTIVTGGCSEEESALPLPTTTTVEATPPPPAAGDWRAVIDDWYDNGVFDRVHRCAAVREAIERLPASTPSYSTHRADLRAYEMRVCSGG
jgi:hypothetical protein